MKKRLLYITIITLSYLSCDKIENPIPPVFGDVDWSLYPGDSTDYLALYNFDNPESNWSTNTNTKKNILLEDYTGHRCTNCPDAADIAKGLENDTSLGVIVASLHASPSGNFQQVVPPEFTIDFTTIAGTEYTNTITTEGIFPGNPCGTINRKSGSPTINSHWYFPDAWVDAVNLELTNPSLLANIQLQYNYFPSKNGLFLHTETEFKDNLTGDYHLIIYLIRESVISPQENSGVVDHHYHHHSVVSDNINGTWGTRIAEGNAVNGDKFYNDFSYELPDPTTDTTFDINNLALITYLCERSSFEVIQVIKTELGN